VTNKNQNHRISLECHDMEGTGYNLRQFQKVVLYARCRTPLPKPLGLHTTRLCSRAAPRLLRPPERCGVVCLPVADSEACVRQGAVRVAA
jgi:hypothetical protein